MTHHYYQRSACAALAHHLATTHGLISASEATKEGANSFSIRLSSGGEQWAMINFAGEAIWISTDTHYQGEYDFLECYDSGSGTRRINGYEECAGIIERFVGISREYLAGNYVQGTKTVKYLSFPLVWKPRSEQVPCIDIEYPPGSFYTLLQEATGPEPRATAHLGRRRHGRRHKSWRGQLLALTAISAVLGLFVIWLGPELTNFYLHPVWQGALTGALVVGVLGMMGRLWSLVVVGVITALLVALPAWLSL